MKPKIKIQNLSFYYQTSLVLDNVHVDIPENTITSISGPSGQGKSSFLTVLNRLWQGIDGAKAAGSVRIDFGNGFEDIMAKNYPLPQLRQKVGMVFQIPNPLPMSIFKNIAFPLKLQGEKNKDTVFKKVKEALEKAYLWEEVKDRLEQKAELLSGGQQQRLCIARSLVTNPQILLLDEPTSSLDKTSLEKIEHLLFELKQDCTIVIVSHYMDQIKRIADKQFILSNKNLKESIA